MTTWTNPDGLKVNFNLQLAEQNPAGVTEKPLSRSFVMEIDTQDYRGVDVAGNTDGREAFIPAGSFITDAYLIVKEGFASAGATTLTIGTAQEDGTVIDVDGIDDSIVKTAIDTVNEVVKVNGNQVAGTTALPSDSYVYVSVGTGPYTAGKAMLVVNYIQT